jgi:MOSC domain-containing protein YiiM
MKVLSVNVGRPKSYDWLGQSVTSSIFKSPVDGDVEVCKFNLAGDEQSDLRVHGGLHKAVYVYPHEHYSYWLERGAGPLTLGNFGENLTTEGLLETDAQIGDELEIGSARFVITQPRLPCSKLGLRFNRAEMTKLFYQSRRFGFYLRVVREGTLRAGGTIATATRAGDSLSLAELIGVYTGDIQDPEPLMRAVRVDALSPGWREDLEQRVKRHRQAAAT